MLKFKVSFAGWTIVNNEQFTKQWKEYTPKLKDWNYVIEIKKEFKKRTLAENRYYWMIISLFACEIWVSVDDLHNEMKYCFLRTVFEWIDWNEIYKIKSTTELSTKDFEQYLECIRRKALEEYNLQIPLPKESWNLDELYA